MSQDIQFVSFVFHQESMQYDIHAPSPVLESDIERT